MKGQDIHFSLYNMSPLTLNPALTGAFSGTVRIGGIYRDQWASFVDRQFTTPSFYADAPIIRGFRKNDWVGVGLMIFDDKAGAGSLRTNTSMLSASYHLALGKGGRTILTLGLQGGNVQRRFDIQSERLWFEDEIETSRGGGGLGQNASQDRGMADMLNTSYLDFNGGVMLRSTFENEMTLELGASFNHVTTPRYTLLTASPGGPDESRRPMRSLAHGRLRAPLSDKWSITPGFLWQNTAGANEVALQNWAGYQINPDVTLNFGAAYRFGDAAEVLAGIDYKDLRVALSYDINTSSLNKATNYKGAFEIAAWYIIKIYKQPDVSPAVLCPKF